MNAGDLIQERYRLEAPLGRGGMAEVWRALDERLQRPVAIKFLTGKYAEDPEFLVRFFSEAQAVAAISHAHVVRVLDFGSGESGPYLVMELVEGGSLCDRVGQPLAVGEAFRLVREAAEGAGAAHAKGIVHRDLKPGNILLTPTATAKLADFGIATLGSVDHLAATGTAIGSPNYISPEGARGTGASPASDVYSLGIVLYELLTGRRPFESPSATAVAMAHVERDPDPPSVHRADLPAWVDELVLTCLAKDPADRYANGDELAAALRTGEAGGPVAPADADGSNSRRVLVASIASAALLALGGFLLATPGAPVAPEAEAEADVGSSPSERRAGAKPTESASPYELDDATTVSTSDPTPSPTPTPDKRADQRQTASSSDDGDDQVTEEEPEPAETPVEEPTEEPTPQETAPTEEETPVEEEPTTSPEEPQEDPAQQSAAVDA